MNEIPAISAYQQNISTGMNDTLDCLERKMKSLTQVECPLKHTFTPGLYCREITMPANCIIVSKIHKTCHPFIISKGSVLVKVNDNEWVRLEAPYQGITEAGTRRVLYVQQETIWTTMHVTNRETVEEVEEDIIEKHEIKNEQTTIQE